MSALLEWSMDSTSVSNPLATAKQCVTSICCGIFFSVGFSTGGSADVVSFSFLAARGPSVVAFFISINLYLTFFIKNCCVFKAASSFDVRHAA